MERSRYPNRFTSDLPTPNVGRSDDVQWAWYGSKVNVEWVGVAKPADGANPPGILYTTTYTSPIFDLRPDLRSSQAGPKQGVPIWSRSARLYIQFGAANLFYLPYPSGIVATTEEFTQNVVVQNNNTVPNLEFIGIADVSSLFNTSTIGQKAILAGFYPPGTTLGAGEGYPVRYWRIQIDFAFFLETGLPIPPPPYALPVFPDPLAQLPTELQAAMY